MRVASSRLVTTALPSGRKATPHGVFRSVAMVPATVPVISTAAAVVDGDEPSVPLVAGALVTEALAEGALVVADVRSLADADDDVVVEPCSPAHPSRRYTRSGPVQAQSVVATAASRRGGTGVFGFRRAVTRPSTACAQLAAALVLEVLEVDDDEDEPLEPEADDADAVLAAAGFDLSPDEPEPESPPDDSPDFAPDFSPPLSRPLSAFVCALVAALVTALSAPLSLWPSRPPANPSGRSRFP